MQEQKYILKNISSFEPRHIFECGQCFRWDEEKDGSYTGVVKNNVINVKKVDNEDLLPFIDDDIRKNLLEVQSGVIAYLLASKIKEDKRTGLDNLKRFIKTNIPINQTPDFSYIGISKDDLIKTSTLDFVNGVNNVGYSK